VTPVDAHELDQFTVKILRSPRIGSGGPAGTFAHVESGAVARELFREDLARGRANACILNNKENYNKIGQLMVEV
jgi:hypothetical protein